MKKFIFTLCALFICIASHAQTETIQWYFDGTLYDTTTCESGGDIDLPTTPTKRGYTFQGWWSYTPIEYLESTGKQKLRVNNIVNSAYYHTSMGISVNTTSYMDFFTGASSAISFNGNKFQLWMRQISGNFLVNTTSITPGTRYNIDVIITQTTASLKVDNNIQTTTLTSSPNVSTFNYLNIDTTSQTYPFLGKIYYIKALDETGNLIVDLIPVLDYNGVPCMFDKVSETFFYNAGTGDFIAGPIVSE